LNVTLLIFSSGNALASSIRRVQAYARSSSVKKLDVATLLGRKSTDKPIMAVMSPSKKKTCRHVWSIPKLGIRENPVAKRPPKAPDKDTTADR
jgi:hypothetical protein